MKDYSKLFGLTKPERTTEKSPQNQEIEENRKKLRPDFYIRYNLWPRSWLTKQDIGNIIKFRAIENSRRKRSEHAR